jgi:NTE family protein
VVASRLGLFLLLALIAGCATRFENQPLPAGRSENPERRFVDREKEPDRPVILIAFSGGGSRAAMLALTVLRELRDTSYIQDGHKRWLIDDVVLLSSVSGGSVTAAHFGLYGAAGLDTLEASFLSEDNVSTVVWQAVNPINWFRYGLSGRSRIGLLEDLFDEKLVKGARFEALNQPGKPFVILNATDMASGEVFAFTPQRFDDICSDFDQQALSVGVAASAAFPVAFTPVAFQNHSLTHCLGRPLPKWISKDLASRFTPYLDVEEYKRARYANDLRHGKDIFEDIQYVYLLDGGVGDNLGVSSLLEAMVSPRASTGLLKAINEGKARKIVVLVVNARSDPPKSVYQQADRPGIFSMIGSVTSVPIDSTTASNNAQMTVLVRTLRQAIRGAPEDAQFRDLRIYDVLIDFDQLRPSDPQQRELRDKAKRVPTSWTLSAEDRATVSAVGRLLLHQHPCYQRLLMDLSVEADFIIPDFAEAGCKP